MGIRQGNFALFVEVIHKLYAGLQIIFFLNDNNSPTSNNSERDTLRVKIPNIIIDFFFFFWFSASRSKQCRENYVAVPRTIVDHASAVSFAQQLVHGVGGGFRQSYSAIPHGTKCHQRL